MRILIKQLFRNSIAGATTTRRLATDVVRCWFYLALIFFSLAVPARLTLADLLYDVTFSSPPYVVGQRPLVQTNDMPRACPTYDRFGDSRVVAVFGGLLDQPLRLVPGPVNQFNYAQLQFNVGNASLYGFPTNYPCYHIGLDLFLDHFDTNDTLSLIFDVPSIVRLDLSDDGTIHQPSPSGMIVMGSVPFGTAFTLAADIDLPGNQWKISVNNQPIYTGQFLYPVPANPNLPDSLFSFRINLSDDPSTPTGPDAAIDNIVVIGVIPEPDTFALTTFAMLFLVVASRRLVWPFVLLVRREPGGRRCRPLPPLGRAYMYPPSSRSSDGNRS